MDKRVKWYLIIIILVVAVGFVGHEFVQSKRASQLYHAGLTAYQNGDCRVALQNTSKAEAISFDLILDFSDMHFGINSIIGKYCREFQAIVKIQEKGQYNKAIVAYEQFIQETWDGAWLMKDINVDMARKQAKMIFNEIKPTEFADESVCRIIDHLKDKDMIADLDTNLPRIYVACGPVFTKRGRYSEAALMYQRLLDEYPKHELAVGSEEKLARALIDEARQAGAGTISQPQRIGKRGAGPACLVIQNDSPQDVSLVFTGLTTRFERIESCDTCKVYSGSGPRTCPARGPIAKYEFPAGTYDVVVKSISDTGVTPFVGKWTFQKGNEYFTCFFLTSK